MAPLQGVLRGCKVDHACSICSLSLLRMLPAWPAAIGVCMFQSADPGGTASLHAACLFLSLHMLTKHYNAAVRDCASLLCC